MAVTGASERHARAHGLPAPVPPPPPFAGAATDEPGPGDTVAHRYRLGAQIHAGSTGIVYRADDLVTGRVVALRLLIDALSRDAEVLARLQARLHAVRPFAESDGDLVDLLDLGRTDDGRVFVVTEHLAGESLAEVLAREGPQPWRAVRPLLVRACQILHRSHEQGMLRLDLQTRHLFPVRDKTRSSTLKILSPGIGEVLGERLWHTLDPAASAEMSRYAAPEQITGEAVDRRTDVYALGVIMYELLAGRPPFADRAPAYTLARHLLEPPPPLPAEVAGAVPEAVLGIVHRALAKRPEARWPTMKALANAMAALDFRPCDASGVLEVDAVEPLGPAASSTTMRIDPAASLSAPSPAVRPRTYPPLPGVFLGLADEAAQPPTTTAGEVATVDASTDAPAATPHGDTHRWSPAGMVATQDHDASTDQGAPPPDAPLAAPRPAAPSADDAARSHDPAASAVRMAWDEILAAAEEAVAAVAAAAATQTRPTSGDSGVFIPESLLRTGQAAPAPDAGSEQSLAATMVMPSTLVRRNAPSAAASIPPLAATSVALADPAAASHAVLVSPPSATAAATGDSSTLLADPAAELSAPAWSREPAARPWLAWAAVAVLALAGAVAVARFARPPSGEPVSAAGDLSPRTGPSPHLVAPAAPIASPPSAPEPGPTARPTAAPPPPGTSHARARPAGPRPATAAKPPAPALPPKASPDAARRPRPSDDAGVRDPFQRADDPSDLSPGTGTPRASDPPAPTSPSPDLSQRSGADPPRPAGAPTPDLSHRPGSVPDPFAPPGSPDAARLADPPPGGG
jgi:serine/threonine-protein kinase